MNFFNLKNQTAELIKDGILKDIKKFLNDGKYINGPQNTLLEKKLSNFTGSKYCCVCSSGTDALLASLMVLNLKPGSEVITSAYSWISVAEVSKILKLKLVFADIDESYNIDLNSIKKKITKNTKVIIPVSLFGQCANLLEIKKFSKKQKIIVIEDAAQSLGARIHDYNSCNIADISCTSFFPTKVLGGYGDGGAIFTNNYSIYKKLMDIINHGSKKRKEYKLIGLNARMDTLQSVLLLKKLRYLKKNINYRQKIAKKYNKFFDDHNLYGKPIIQKNFQSVFSQYTICVKKRNSLKKILDSYKIPYKVYYPKPIYSEPAYKQNIILENTEFVTKHSISLPLEEKASKKILIIFNKIAKRDIFFE